MSLPFLASVRLLCHSNAAIIDLGDQTLVLGTLALRTSLRSVRWRTRTQQAEFVRETEASGLYFSWLDTQREFRPKTNGMAITHHPVLYVVNC